MAAIKKSLKVNCPTCKKVFHYYDSGFRPFCCERCKLVDLGHWFEENYSVAGEKLQVTPEEYSEDHLESPEMHEVNEDNEM